MDDQSRRGDLQRLGDLLGDAGIEVPRDVAELAACWDEVVGVENARNARPRTLKRGRLVVATSSSVWAQTLQFMADDIRRRLNAALGEDAVREIVFRPAGWDPGGDRAAPGALAESRRANPDAVSGADGGRRPPRRALSAAEEAAVEDVRRKAGDPELGDRISRAMRASLSRSTRG